MNDQLLHPTALAALYPASVYPDGYPAYTRADWRADASGTWPDYWTWVHAQLEKESS